MTSGYNWRITLVEFARIASVLSGFCVTFIALTLGGKIADTVINNTAVTFGQISALFFGISCSLLITAAEFFIKAKDFDIYGIPERYIQLLKKDCEIKGEEWNAFEESQTRSCRVNESLGRHCYNLGIFGIFLGLIFAITPYNGAIGIFVGGLGVSLQILQIIQARKSPKTISQNPTL